MATPSPPPSVSGSPWEVAVKQAARAIAWRKGKGWKPETAPASAEDMILAAAALSAALPGLLAAERERVLAIVDNEMSGTLMAAAWGNDSSWLTNGNKVASLVRTWIKDALDAARTADIGEPK